jgi:hypothetical protein
LYGAQLKDALVLQVPVPSHWAAGVRLFEASQLAAAHCVPAGHFSQAPAPSHFPSVPQVV